jgi:hypothetical protein
MTTTTETPEVNPYIETRNAESRELHALAMQIARHLEGYTFDRKSSHDCDGMPYPSATLAGPEGRKLHVHRISYGASKGRIEIGAVLPMRAKRETVSVGSVQDITVAGDRSPEAIAKEITRRIMPAYAIEFPAALAKVQANDAYHQAGEDAAKELAQLVDAAKPRENSPREFSIYRGDFFGSVKCSGGSVNIELNSLTVEQARKVCSVLVSFALKVAP